MEQHHIDLVCFADDTNMVHRENLAAEERKLITEIQNDFGGVIHRKNWQHLRARREKSRRQKAEEAATEKDKRVRAQNWKDEEKKRVIWEDIEKLSEKSDDDKESTRDMIGELGVCSRSVGFLDFC